MAGKRYKTDEALGIIIRIALTWIYPLQLLEKKDQAITISQWSFSSKETGCNIKSNKKLLYRRRDEQKKERYEPRQGAG